MGRVHSPQEASRPTRSAIPAAISAFGIAVINSGQMGDVVHDARAKELWFGTAMGAVTVMRATPILSDSQRWTGRRLGRIMPDSSIPGAGG